MTESLFRSMIEAARGLKDRTGAFWTDQLNNADQLAAYHSMGDEIWHQTGGDIDAFVQSVGTSDCYPSTHRSRRDPVIQRPQVPDAGLPDRSRHIASTLDRRKE